MAYAHNDLELALLEHKNEDKSVPLNSFFRILGTINESCILSYLDEQSYALLKSTCKTTYGNIDRQYRNQCYLSVFKSITAPATSMMNLTGTLLHGKSYVGSKNELQMNRDYFDDEVNCCDKLAGVGLCFFTVPCTIVSFPLAYVAANSGYCLGKARDKVDACLSPAGLLKFEETRNFRMFGKSEPKTERMEDKLDKTNATSEQAAVSNT
jgi:hypothetical protein